MTGMSYQRAPYPFIKPCPEYRNTYLCYRCIHRDWSVYKVCCTCMGQAVSDLIGAQTTTPYSRSYIYHNPLGCLCTVSTNNSANFSQWFDGTTPYACTSPRTLHHIKLAIAAYHATLRCQVVHAPCRPIIAMCMNSLSWAC